MPIFPKIWRVSYLLNNFSDISRQEHENARPVFLTKHGRSDMVVMSIEAYESDVFQSEIYHKLKEAEIQSESTAKRYSHGEVMDRLQTIIDGD
jgi:PHD/YefM family antitoxin component YafN of YafNO toxin-antitoxin module